MKIHKPLKTGIIHKTYEQHGRYYFVATMINFFSFAETPFLETEIDLWKFLPKAMGDNFVFEMGMPKPRGEVLVWGSFFAPNNVKVQGGHVRVKIADIDKVLYVFGERRWKRQASGMLSISDPKPIAEMSISYDRAFGGPGYKKNPIGIGVKPIALETGKEAHVLPNIENPQELITSTLDKPAPAGFGPLDIMWIQRQSKAGTYDEKWLMNNFPGFPDDFDWAFHNAAPEDQQLPGFFNGAELFEIENMHPQKPFLHAGLPGMRSRCFIRKEEKEAATFHEVDTRLDTIWLFPEHEKGILVFRGVTEVQSEEAEEIAHLLVAYERLDQTFRPIGHYENALTKRLDPDNGHLHSLDEKDLIPPDEVSGLSLILKQAENEQEENRGLLQKNLQKRAQRLKEEIKEKMQAVNLEPNDMTADKSLEPPQFDPENIDGFIQNVETLEKEALKRASDAKEKLKQDLAKMGHDYDELVKKAKRSGGGRPEFSAERIIDLLKQSGLEGPDVEEKIYEIRRKIDQSYRDYGHHFPAAPIPPDDAKLHMRGMIIEGYQQGESFAGMDFTGVDLSNLDLTGIVFTNAFLEGANLTGCNLEGSDLSGCVMVRGNLSAARVASANLKGANLGGALLEETNFTGSDLRQAVFAKAQLRRARVKEALLDEADFFEANVAESDFSGSRLKEAQFLETNLSKTLFLGCKLQESLFYNAVLAEADFSGSDLTSSVLVNVNGKHIRFKGANLSDLTTAMETTFEGADFQQANLTGANLRGTALAYSDFKDADLTGADFSQADLRGANLSFATAIQTQFVKTDLTDAGMKGINLFEGSLQKAILHNTELQGSNLYAVDFIRVDFRNTNVSGANVKKAFLERWISK